MMFKTNALMLLCSSAPITAFAVPRIFKTAFGVPKVLHSGLRSSSSDETVIVPEPNPPDWSEFKSVILIDPGMTKEEIMELVKPIHDKIIEGATNPEDPNKDDPEKKEIIYGSGRHFVEDRYAVFFKPGTYKDLDIQIGYYTQLAGLGAKADDVLFTDCAYGPYCPALRKDENIGGRPGLSLDTFWRVAENYCSNADKGQLWAVSQAAPIRRVHVKKDLLLHDAGAQASGGHLANAVVDGKISFGSQQQWCCRSVDMNRYELGAWSNVFIDCKGGPTESGYVHFSGGRNVAVTVDSTPEVTVEKPFVAIKDDGKKYELRVPQPRKKKYEGWTFVPSGADLNGENDVTRDFEMVHVASADDEDFATKIKQALKDGKDIVLSPGIYDLAETLEVDKDNQVILGVGLATLVAPTDGSPCIKVAPKTEGVRIAGIMLEASNITNKKVRVACFIEWGDEGAIDDHGNPDNPGVLTDIFARVGGSNLDRHVSTDVMIRIHSSHVYGDNLWLWRADHVALNEAIGEEPNFPPLEYHQVTLGEVPCKTGLEVNGNDVTVHGLAVEHTTEHQTIWNGERGNVQFYQSELPYDVTSDFGDKGYRGYKVGAMSHKAGGVGIYSNFRDHVVPVAMGIEHPKSLDITFTNPFTVHLNNYGLIRSIINGEGDPTCGVRFLN